ncbi:hypothetical protein M404DRAFT_1009162 [Pisolithus tinctorius Marx 270]|uniref:Uncharacterized protein n=1 Tax=Pisolithus tinctorius Marx 270 TaxID=870435 RepID=A0A0C3I7L6_PISTI|nr:hypothetical protein M404DRAFT_1009162 [Pisolithus tinctorius Marx 270]
MHFDERFRITRSTPPIQDLVGGVDKLLDVNGDLGIRVCQVSWQCHTRYESRANTHCRKHSRTGLTLLTILSSDGPVKSPALMARTSANGDVTPAGQCYSTGGHLRVWTTKLLATVLCAGPGWREQLDL